MRTGSVTASLTAEIWRTRNTVSHIQLSVCPSIRPSLRLSVCPSLSVRLSLSFSDQRHEQKSLSSKTRAKNSHKAIQKRSIGWQSFNQYKNVVVFDKPFDVRMADEIQTEMIYCYCFRALRTHLRLENTV